MVRTSLKKFSLRNITMEVDFNALDDPLNIRHAEDLAVAWGITPDKSYSHQRLDRVRLGNTKFQIPIGLILQLNYLGIPCSFEGFENIPDKPVIYAMNHGPSQYPYWPFQWELFKERGDLTTVWVKGKHMDKSKAVRNLFTLAGLIPIVDRNYFGEKVEGRSKDISFYHEQLLLRSGRLTHQALEQGLSVIIFPDGTRTPTVGKGLEGTVQAAYHTGAEVIPIGCTGAERIYPDGVHPSWWARKTEAYVQEGPPIYRVGVPIDLDEERAKFKEIEEREGPSLLLSRTSKERHREISQSGTQKLMRAINYLVDESLRNADYL